MRIDEALKLLGIPDGVPVTVSIVMKAWKRKMLQLHPDKNPSVDANIDTQRAIEAKNTIIEKIKEQQQRKAADAAAAAAAARGSIHRRLHRKAGGQPVVDDMRQHILKTYQMVSKSRVLVRDVLDDFVASRVTTTEVERNLFKRHCKHLFTTTIVGAKCSKYKDKRCFTNVAKK